MENREVYAGVELYKIWFACDEYGAWPFTSYATREKALEVSQKEFGTNKIAWQFQSEIQEEE